MPRNLLRPRSLLIALASCFFAVLALSYTRTENGPRAATIAKARSQLLASSVRAHEAQPPCEAQRARLKSMLTSTPTPESPEGMGCELAMLDTLRFVLEEAEADFDARRFDAAFFKALAVLAHNQAVLGHRSLLAISVAGARATKALALMQRSAARSLSPAQRTQWRAEVETLLQRQLEDDRLATAIVAGEARAYLLADDDSSLASELPRRLRNKMTLAYANLQRSIELGSGFLPACLEIVREVPVCTHMARAESEQRALGADIELLVSILEPS